MAKRIEYVNSKVGRYFYVPGSSHIAAYAVSTPTTSVPDEMLTVPEWVNGSHVDSVEILGRVVMALRAAV